jgi:hypothetical protein
MDSPGRVGAMVWPYEQGNETLRFTKIKKFLDPLNNYSFNIRLHCHCPKVQLKPFNTKNILVYAGTCHWPKISPPPLCISNWPAEHYT